MARDFALNNSGEGRADIALDACECLFKGVRWVPLEIDSVEVRLEGNLIWWDPEAFGLDGIERQQVRLLLALVRDRKGVQVTLRHVVMAPSDHGEEFGCPQLQTGAAGVASAGASMSVGSSETARTLSTRFGTGQSCSTSFGDRVKSSNSCRRPKFCSPFGFLLTHRIGQFSVRGSFVGNVRRKLKLYCNINSVWLPGPDSNQRPTG